LYWFVSVKIKGLGYYLEQSKLYTVTHFSISRGGYCDISWLYI